MKIIFFQSIVKCIMNLTNKPNRKIKILFKIKIKLIFKMLLKIPITEILAKMTKVKMTNQISVQVQSMNFRNYYSYKIKVKTPLKMKIKFKTSI